MRGVLVAFDLPGFWAVALSRRLPELGLRILSVVPTGPDRCVQVVELAGPLVPEALAYLEDAGLLERALRVEDAPGRVVLRMPMRRSALAPILVATGVVPLLPFEVRAGEVRWLLLGDGGYEVLHAFLRDRGVDVRVVRTGDWEAAKDDLTEHQRAVLAAAVEAGYYGHPRRITMTRLAKDLGVCKSTLSETLMIIEHKVLQAHQRAQAAALRPA